jgi:pyrimidine operon attenuation protein/uracil phosphoribosyltransferase
MEQENRLILDAQTIDRKLRRMAYQIYERNLGERSLILAGIYDRGHVVARRLAGLLEEIADFELRIIHLTLDRKTPREVIVSEPVDFDNQVVILVDDVANSGKTMLYAMKPLLNYLPRRIQTAVLVDRMHKAFPVVINYVGHSLSTTLQENITVAIAEGEIRGAYLH